MKPQDKQIPRRIALSICKGLFERLGELIDSHLARKVARLLGLPPRFRHLFDRRCFTRARGLTVFSVHRLPAIIH
jgi:hypothetical protein